MLLGLNHMHSMGVVHRDVKGENVLLNLDGQVKIGKNSLFFLLFVVTSFL